MASKDSPHSPSHRSHLLCIYVPPAVAAVLVRDLPTLASWGVISIVATLLVTIVAVWIVVILLHSSIDRRNE